MTRESANEAFVREFQARAGLDSDGWAGSRTYAALDQVMPKLPSETVNSVTERIALELIAHEAIVQEAYKDSVGVWTWGVGVTSASGHSVERYKDNPQTIQRCLEVYVWLLNEKYAPDVMKAFGDRKLTESQFGAALSFHWNTGAIGRATWVKSWLAGREDEARAKFMEWRKPAAIIERRQKECDLFFDGKWSATGFATVYPVRKPNYAPDWSGARKVDVRADLKEAMKPR